MHKSTSLPKLPEAAATKPLTIELATHDIWQKGAESVANGAKTIFTEITKALAEDRGLLVGRTGTIELTTILQSIQNNRQSFDEDNAAILQKNAGIFPSTDESLRDWCLEYSSAMAEADIMAVGWYKPLARPEWSLLNIMNKNLKKIPLRSLEPWYVEPVDHWTRVLEGQSVCVVSSFARTMVGQLDRRELVWQNHDSILPLAKWSFVRSYYSPLLAQGRCEWPSAVKSWRDAVDYMEEQVLATGARIVLIGCGGLGMVLARRLKAKGLICIVMGGAIQVLFGIKGSRWADHPVISRFWNSAWTFPGAYEVPSLAKIVEGGCYW